MRISWAKILTLFFSILSLTGYVTAADPSMDEDLCSACMTDDNGRRYQIEIEKLYDDYYLNGSGQYLVALKNGSQVDIRGEVFVGEWNRNVFNQLVFALVLLEFDPPVRLLSHPSKHCEFD